MREKLRDHNPLEKFSKSVLSAFKSFLDSDCPSSFSNHFYMAQLLARKPWRAEDMLRK